MDKIYLFQGMMGIGDDKGSSTGKEGYKGDEGWRKASLKDLRRVNPRVEMFSRQLDVEQRSSRFYIAQKQRKSDEYEVSYWAHWWKMAIEDQKNELKCKKNHLTFGAPKITLAIREVWMTNK